MKIIMSNSLKDYMNEKGQKDLVLYIGMCGT